ncbi:hypothetical protein L1987_64510 [Smallanthus sonchifolius]|uniref:Uncharacterized protein n=1 Tax=Smallanthus sonchifolius TaxID=185202 RepID=A0ACB9CGC2_9ASTR|nr:hypothetical protein L1987_64510 [Smallanthus sonchifolius]
MDERGTDPPYQTRIGKFLGECDSDDMESNDDMLVDNQAKEIDSVVVPSTGGGGTRKLSGLSHVHGCVSLHDVAESASDDGGRMFGTSSTFLRNNNVEVCMGDSDHNQTTRVSTEVKGNLVFLNKEYTGMSIPFNLDNSLLNLGTETSEWNKLILEPIKLIWPEVWGMDDELDLENTGWSEVLDAVRLAWNDEFGEGSMDVRYDPIVECLTKWEGCQKIWDLGSGRMIRKRNVDQEGEIIPRHRNKKKKRGARKNASFINNEGMHEGNSMGTIDEAMIESDKSNAEDSLLPVQGSTQTYGNTNYIREEKIQYYPPLINKEGDRVAVIDLRPRINEEKGQESKDKNEGFMDRGDVQNKNTYEDGFTLVKKKKGGNLASQGSRQPQKHSIPSKHNIRNQDEFKSNGKGPRNMDAIAHKKNNPGFHNLQDKSESSRARDNQRDAEINSNNDVIETPRVMQKVVNNRETGSMHGSGKRKTSSGATVIETSNRFNLVENDGNEVDMDIEGEGINANRNNELVERNKGWIRRQERSLNTNFSGQLSKEQRLEAKRYVLDKYVPLESVLSEWSEPLLQYFRHLCNIHNFWSGYLAVARGKDSDGLVNEMNLDNSEDVWKEVKSETEGAAGFMKSDDPITSGVVGLLQEEGDINIRSRQDVDMHTAGPELQSVNGS